MQTVEENPSTDEHALASAAPLASFKRRSSDLSQWGLGKLALLATNNDRALALSYGVCGRRQNLAQLVSNRL